MIIDPSTLQPVPGAPSPDVRARMLSDCLDSMSEDYKPSLAPKDAVLEKGREVRARVIRAVRPQLSNPALFLNPEALQKIFNELGNAYANEFAQWSHEDLCWLVTILHTEMMAGKIRAELGM